MSLLFALLLHAIWYCGTALCGLRSLIQGSTVRAKPFRLPLFPISRAAMRLPGGGGGVPGEDAGWKVKTSLSLFMAFYPASQPSLPASTWYALRTFWCKEEHLASFLKGEGLEVFVPMRYAERAGGEGKVCRVLVPAVHNLLFLKKTFIASFLGKLSVASPVPFRVLERADRSAPAEIRDCEMARFRAVCDPEYRGTVYLGADEAEARPGSRVRVTHGAFAGLEGKLTRYKGRYYVVVSLATVGVLVHIPKWYCEKLDP